MPAAQLIIRIDPRIKGKLASLSKAHGKTASQTIRELIEGYLHDNDIAGHIDAVWHTIGGKLRSKGLTADDVPALIRKSRAGRT